MIGFLNKAAARAATSSAAMAAALLAGAPAIAQTASPVATPDSATPAPLATGAPATADASTTPDAEIVVTGSRIQRSGYNSPTPVAVVNQDRVEKLGATNIGDALFQVPAFRAGTSPTTSGLTAGTIGAHIADLRGLGATRTLVMIDGQRVVPSTSVNTVDLNLIPSVLVQRTDVVTGGASAAYGSDAVAGVVNIIMDNKFEGLKGNVQYGVSRYGDGKDYQASLAYGTSFGGGRGHFVIGGEYEDSKAVGDCYTRPWCAEERQNLTNSTPGVNGIPAQILATNVHTSTQTRGGLITSGPLKGIQFNPDGSPTQFVYGTLVGGLFMLGGSGAGQNAYVTGVDIKVPVERISTYTHASYEFNDWLTGYVEGNFARVDGRNIGGASRNPGTGQTAIVIKTDNPFIPAGLRTIINNYNTANPAAPITSFPIGREGYDIGFSRGRDLTNTYRGVVGFDAKIGSHWRAGVYYQYGESDFHETIENNQVKPNFFYAVDATTGPNGLPVCRATLSADPAVRAAAAGCQPLNLFGQYNFSNEAKAYAYQTSFTRRRYDQSVLSGNIQGEPFSTWAGPVSIAVGVEHRSETAHGSTDALSQQLFFTTGNGTALNGHITVTEGYAETIVPLLRDVFLAKNLELNAAVRRTHYSTSGSVTTWKVGGVYEPTDWLRLRTTESRDIRAPNMTELFVPLVANQNTIIDTATHTTAVLPFLSGGNPNLTPEKAKTFTAGFVLQPRGIFTGFHFSFDYYNIKVNNAISTLSTQNVVTQCNNGQTDYCQYVTRGSDGLITLISTPYLNLNQLKTNGFDIVADYNLPLRRLSPGLPGTLSFNFTTTHIAHLTTVQKTGALDVAGVTGCSVTSFIECTPHWTYDGIVSYAVGRMSLTAHGHYVPKSVYDPTLVGPGDPGYSPSLANSIDPNRVAGAFYLSLMATYNVLDRGKQHLQLYFGVDNVADKNPPLMPGRANNTFFDPVGRYYKMGARFQY
ncbi:TonB-dependent receptor plug domain-containing protein [Sphingomonas sp. MMS24-J13]|uniref:TonB-dependent receptor plug domain-containing protein n=1 Tax=Sphingomonas sp. MMS24-J13 TaxID=3238686 RepID=UPI0038511DF0